MLLIKYIPLNRLIIAKPILFATVLNILIKTNFTKNIDIKSRMCYTLGGKYVQIKY